MQDSNKSQDETVRAYAICDTDGGRHEPRPLLRHIFATKDGAVACVKYHGFVPEYYPVMEVEIRIVGEGE